MLLVTKNQDSKKFCTLQKKIAVVEKKFDKTLD